MQLKKFNIFDFFTILVPGVIISILFCISLSYKYYETWNTFGSEKYTVFIIISYLCGVAMQQIGNILDEKVLYKYIYGGHPREIFLLKDEYNKVLNSELSYNEALKIREHIIDKYEINCKNIKNIKQLNVLVFSYCLILEEKNHLTYKSDKMLVISEMSRSLFLGCIFTLFLNFFMIYKYKSYYKFYMIESILLLVLAFIFAYRKVQYEKYRYNSVLKTFLVYMNEK